MASRGPILKLAALSTFAIVVVACLASHPDRPRGGPCGTKTCAQNEYCCNASCSMCTAPGTVCPSLLCIRPPVQPAVDASDSAVP